MGFDANDGSDLPNLTDEEFQDLISFVTWEQNLQQSYLQPQGFILNFPRPLAEGIQGPWDEQAWNFNGV